MRLKLTCKHCRRNIEIEGEGHVPAIECPNCNVVLNLPSNILDVDSELGGFKVIRHLGSGSMGCVYLATQVSMDRDVALKVLPPEFKTKEDELQNFMKEVRLLAKLDHRNIVTAFEAGEADGNYYMAMTYVQGETLEDMIARDGPLDELEALNIARKIASALKYAWEKHQILHRDVKPENIMIDERNAEPKLLDMGISKTLNDDAGDSGEKGVLVGTPHYMSPEQAKSQDIDCRADMYSLGCSLYQFLTGKVPFDAESVMNVLTKHALDPVPNPKELNESLHKTTVDLIKRMMAKAPNHRFEDWDELIKEIRQSIRSIKNGGKPKKAGNQRPQVSIHPKRRTATRPDTLTQDLSEDTFDEPTDKKLARLLTTVLVIIIVTLLAVLGVMKLKPSGGANRAGDDKTTKQTGDEGRNAIEETRRRMEAKREDERKRAYGEEQERLAQIERRFSQLVKQDPESPQTYEPVLANYQVLLKRAQGTPTEAKVLAHIDQLKVKQAEQTTQALKALQSQATPFIIAGKYEEAIGVYKNYDGVCMGETKEKRDEWVQRLSYQQARQLEAKFEFSAFAEKAASLLANGQLDKAAMLAKSCVDKKGDFGAHAKLVLEIAEMDQIVLKHFSAYVDKASADGTKEMLTVRLNDATEKVTIEKVSNGTVHSLKEFIYKGTVGKKGVSFTPSDLHPNERLKLLKPKVSTEAYSFIKGLVAMDVKKFTVARAEFRRSERELGKRLLQYVDIKSGNPEEWAEVEFMVLLKSLGIKEGSQMEMSRQAMDLNLPTVQKVRLKQSLDVFLFRFGQTRKARESISFLYLLKDALTPTKPVEKEQIEATLRELRMVNRVKSLKTKASPVLGGIRLDLSGNLGLDTIKPDSLQDIGVRELILQGTSFKDPAILGALPLRTLDLSNCPVTSIRGFGSKALQKLNLASCRLTALPTMRDYPILTSLDLSGNPIRSIRGLAGSTVTELNLQNCLSITDLSPLFEMPQLKTLIISKEAKGFIQLRRLKHLKKVGYAPDKLLEAGRFWQLAEAEATAKIRNAYAEKIKVAVANLIRRHNDPDLEYAELIKTVSFHPTGIGLNFRWQRSILDLSDFQDIPVASIWLEGSGVKSLEPLRNSPVEEVYARRSRVTSLAPLAKAPLRVLEAQGTDCNPISYLSGWPDLVALSCNSTSLRSLKVFEDTEVEHLALYGGRFMDLSPLIRTPIRSLRIEQVPLTDLSPLKECRNLKDLFIAHTSVSDLQPLSGLTLSRLDVSYTNVRSLHPIEGDPLVGLWMTKTAITDLSPLRKAKLSHFFADESSISDIGILRGMPIRYLRIGKTAVADFTPIGTFNELRELWVHSTTFNDLGLLMGKPLRELRLDGCEQILNIEALGNLTGLRNLTIPRREIDGIFALRRLARLSRINHKYDNWRTRVDEYFGIE